MNSICFTQLIFHNGGLYHIETSLLIICPLNQGTGFYMIGTTSVMNELIQRASINAFLGDLGEWIFQKICQGHTQPWWVLPNDFYNFCGSLDNS